MKGKKCYKLSRINTIHEKDIPFYHNFTFPELGAFKCFFWLKSVNPDPAYTKEIFSIEKYKEQFSELTSKIYQLQLQVPTKEIWNVECVNVTIRQVEYFRETKSFASEKDAFIVYEKMIQVMDLIEHYAECGEKRLPEKPNFKGAPYYAYINEVIFGDNSILVELNDNKIVYINHGNYHYIMTETKDLVNSHTIIFKISFDAPHLSVRQTKKTVSGSLIGYVTVFINA